MAQQHINYGTAPNDGTGDTLRESQRKAEENFTELYTMGGGGSVAFRTFKISADNPYELLASDKDKHLWLNAVTQINVPAGLTLNDEFVVTSAGGVTLSFTFGDPDVADPLGTQQITEFQTVTIKKILSDAWLIIR